jgi:hypothetical protein
LNPMTLNAMMTYIGVALIFAAAIFFVLGTQRLRKRPTRSPGNNVGAPVYDPAVLVVRRADFLCGAMLLVVALVAAAISIARGGPAVGEPDGNTGGAVILISLTTFFCVIVCLIARHLILVHLLRKLDTPVGSPPE